jgi:ribosomal protein S18 acetylase RimI-like enzyme
VAVSGTATIRPGALPDVLALDAEVFGRPGEALVRYARLFPHTFYIVEEGAAVIGFCSCYVRPVLSPAGPVLRARIFAIAVHPARHGQGIARRMLGRCMAEMDRNGVASVDLFVDRENRPALAAYSRFGLAVVDEVPDVCGRGKRCYRLERTFRGSHEEQQP